MEAIISNRLETSRFVEPETPRMNDYAISYRGLGIAPFRSLLDTPVSLRYLNFFAITRSFYCERWPFAILSCGTCNRADIDVDRKYDQIKNDGAMRKFESLEQFDSRDLRTPRGEIFLSFSLFFGT